ncbi:MAG: sulfatase-like hydrolase/transferase [Pirellulaceae bacterium]|nr:sulfatase-like hydrolase/transferase [Pirellulaceae bacterium]
MRRLCVLAGLALLATSAIAIGYPSGTPFADSSSLPLPLAIGWVVAQVCLIVLPALLLGWVAIRYQWPAGQAISIAGIYCVPLIVLADCVVFHWISQRFLSRATLAVLGQLHSRLASEMTTSTWLFAITLIGGFVLFVIGSWWLAAKLGRAFQFQPWSFVALVVAILVAFSVVPIWNLRQTRAEMYAFSTRHPLCAFHLVAATSVGTSAGDVGPGIRGNTESMKGVLAALEDRQRDLRVVHHRQDLPDVVIVVIESMRPELVAADVMPTLWRYTQKGIHCRQHFSAGNATNHGMFSLLNGLEATWYSRAVRDSPILNRLFRQAGYELGFFAGHDGWRRFRMDGFIGPQHYDRFQTERPGWLESDQRATRRAANFLDADRTNRGPRLAVVYLYSTHADYHSYPDDRIFQPAADDRFLIPFSQQARDGVWNRYKNSGRSVDRFLSVLLKDDRVAIVTGDHGESFLEDGVCGHGVRISQYQNMTPAVVYVPGQHAATIDRPTMHADLLPTLLAAVGIQSNDSDLFDGVNLLRVNDAELAERCFITRDYLSDDCALIGPWTVDPMKPFAYRVDISLEPWRASLLNPIDRKGDQINEKSGLTGLSAKQSLRQWANQRFGKEAVASFPDSSIGR